MNTYEFILNIKDAKITALISENFCTADFSTEVPVHTHSYTEIFGVVDAPFTVKTVDSNFCVGSSALIVIPRDLYHFVNSRGRNFRLQLKAEKRAFKEKSMFYAQINALLSAQEIKRFALISPVVNIFKEIEKELQNPAPDNDYMSALLNAFLLKFAGAFESTQKRVYIANNNYVFKINDILNRHYKNGLYISDVAKELNLSTRQVLRVIKANYNKTFSQLLTEKRLAVAAYMLTNTRLSIENITSLSGFNCASSLYYSFKNHYGLSPYKYRKKNDATL